MSGKGIYTELEVSQHNDDKSCWLVIDGQIYDVTPFLGDHPGGSDFLLDYAGKADGSATQAFKDPAVHEHSNAAKNILKSYHIGRLDSAPALTDNNSNNSNNSNNESPNVVDMKKAVVPQVLKLKREYQPWVHNSQTAMKGFRIFEGSFWESFTHYPWWYIFFMWIPVISITFKWSLDGGSNWPISILMFLIGGFTWSLIEYILHRFVFHMYTETGIMNFFHFIAHGIHHLTPTDPSRLAFPPSLGVVVGTLFYKLVVGLGGQGPWQAAFAGGAFIYMMYDAMHYYFHHGDRLWWAPSYFKWMKSRHMDHHYKNENLNFGVTSPLWDYVFGTDATSANAHSYIKNPSSIHVDPQQ